MSIMKKLDLLMCPFCKKTHVKYCVDLNKKDPQRFIYLNRQSPGIVTERIKRIRRCDLVGVGMAMLEGVCHWRSVLRFQKPMH